VERISRKLRLGGLGVTTALVLALTLAGAVGAKNRQTFADPAGDNQSASTSAYASDIRQVDVSSEDNGDLRIAVTLVDGPARLVAGDQLDVYLDTDRKQSTGQNGFDIDLVAKGNSGGAAPSFFLCRLSNPVTCENAVSGFGHDQATATSTHVVDFNLSTGIPAFDFGVVAQYPNPNNANTPLTDIAPNSGVWTYQVMADPDRDGLHGTSDKCPTKAARGKFDRNGNGCPGPFSFIHTQEPHFRAVPQSGFLQLSGLRLTGLPIGAHVQFAAGSIREATTVGGSGTARSRRISGALRYGKAVTIKVTKSAWVGVYLKLVVDRRVGLRSVRKQCIPATGSQTPVGCGNKALRGS
jgi:hypothetical protein